MSFAAPFHAPVLLSGPTRHTSVPASPGVSEEPWGIAQVRTKIARPVAARDELGDIRPLVAQLVRGEAYVTGSKMLAYDNVGRAIGKSGSWVRKLVGHGDVALQYVEFLNIVRAYDRLCARVDAAAAANRLRAAQLRSFTDAAVVRADRPVAGPSRGGSG